MEILAISVYMYIYICMCNVVLAISKHIIQVCLYKYVICIYASILYVGLECVSVEMVFSFYLHVDTSSLQAHALDVLQYIHIPSNYIFCIYLYIYIYIYIIANASKKVT